MVKVGEIYIDEDHDIYKIVRLYNDHMDICMIYFGGGGFERGESYDDFNELDVSIIENNGGVLLNNKLIEILYGVDQC